MKRTRRNHGATVTAPVALAAVTGDKTRAEFAAQVQVHPTQLTDGTQPWLVRAADVFGGPTPPAATPALKPRHATMGQRARAHDCLAGALTKAGGRRATP